MGGTANPDGLARRPFQGWVALVLDDGVIAVALTSDRRINRGHLPVKKPARRFGERLQILRRRVNRPLPGPVGFGNVCFPKVMGRMPGQHEL